MCDKMYRILVLKKKKNKPKKSCDRLNLKINIQTFEQHSGNYFKCHAAIKAKGEHEEILKFM